MSDVLNDLEIVNAKHQTNYPLGTALWYGVTDTDRDIAKAQHAKTATVLREQVESETRRADELFDESRQFEEEAMAYEKQLERTQATVETLTIERDNLQKLYDLTFECMESNGEQLVQSQERERTVQGQLNDALILIAEGEDKTDRLREALKQVILLIEHETGLPDSAANGVTGAEGHPDEGVIRASEILWHAAQALKDGE